MKAIMVDLETTGLNMDSAIVQIGAVEFDWTQSDPTQVIRSRMKHNVSIATQGRTIDAKTLWFWMQQPKEKLAIFNPDEGISLEEMLKLFAAFCRGADEIWSNGADYDIAILKDCYSDAGEEYPWKYSSTRCFRTQKELYPGHGDRIHAGLHDALLDAEHQAMWCWRIMQARKIIESIGLPKTEELKKLGL